MVEIFKTNITKQKQSRQIIEKLNETFPKYKINFDGIEPPAFYER